MDESKGVPVLSFAQLKILKEQKDKAVKEQYMEKCKNRLSNILSKKIETSFIGAIANFEEKFGFLWGIALHDNERTEEQKQFYEIWQAVRSEILTNGNNQIRATKHEISQYDIYWKRYHTEFKILTEENKNDQE